MQIYIKMQNMPTDLSSKLSSTGTKEMCIMASYREVTEILADLQEVSLE